jgi:hypothetical protein
MVIIVNRTDEMAATAPLLELSQFSNDHASRRVTYV